jgi:Ser/Thr protein kinase RdoA (MazF antagonist)
MTDAGAFGRLPLEQQLARLTALADTALSRWGLAGSTLEILKHRENTVFKVQTPGGERFAMRVHRADYRTDQELLSELQWLEALRAAGIGTTEARRTLDGEFFVTTATADLTEGRQCDLLAWVPGQPIGSLEHGVALDAATLARVYRRVGDLAARIHTHGEHWPLPAGFRRHAWDENGFFGETGAVCGRYWDLELLTPDQLALLHRARDATAAALGAFGKTPDRYGLVHGDMLPENVFYDGVDVHLIDWDDSGFGWHLVDFATALFAHLAQPSFDAALAAMVEGYRAQRALPDEHLAVLPYLIMARALSYVGWVHTRGAAGTPLGPLAIMAACALAEDVLAGRSGAGMSPGSLALER